MVTFSSPQVQAEVVRMSNSRRYSTQTTHFTPASDISDYQDHHMFTSTMNPSSGLLQDLLREKKASQRTSHISEHDSVTYDRQVQSSPIGPSAASKPHSRRASGLTGPKEMGLREMEEVIAESLRIEQHTNETHSTFPSSTSRIST